MEQKKYDRMKVDLSYPDNFRHYWFVKLVLIAVAIIMSAFIYKTDKENDYNAIYKDGHKLREEDKKKTRRSFIYKVMSIIIALKKVVALGPTKCKKYLGKVYTDEQI